MILLRLTQIVCRQNTLQRHAVVSRLSAVNHTRTVNNRFAATQRKETDESRSVVQSDGKSFNELTFPEKVKQTGKDASYTVVIIAGIAVTGVMFYFILRELFSGDSVNGVYTRAVKACVNDEAVQEALGAPIKGYGETTRRGRRRYPSHAEYEHDGVQYMRMKFYLQGSRRKATAHLEMKQTESKHFEYRYLFVELDTFPHETIILEDKR